METLATIDAPHQEKRNDDPQPEPNPTVRPETEQKKRQKSRQCTQQKPRLQSISRPEHVAPLQSTGNMITELATALTLAARAPSSAYDLPTFYGAHQEWLMFKASYVDTHMSFTEHENMLRLRKSLRGKAKDAVRNLLNYSKNPETVMNALEKRFGRPDAIAIAEIQNLRTLQRPTDSPNNTYEFAGDFTNIISSLRKLKKEYYLYTPEIIKCTLDKFTSAIKYRWFDFSAKLPQEPHLIKMARYLEREAERCSAYAPPETITQPRGDTITQTKRIQKTFFTSANRRENTEPNRSPRPCPVREKTGHVVTDCETFMKADSNKRWNLAKSHFVSNC
ncbi:hypothetical protein EVAR_56087_1 [Eumeta japonica]|uniref:Uncharacterized protein n=1 Tax=Eumeta variegata TaxID=151549 RepID=A0A4C1YMM0_EUMVA|nr:hypothetical protein EVAR_56087_1 [Eumeta japonica]